MTTLGEDVRLLSIRLPASTVDGGEIPGWGALVLGFGVAGFHKTLRLFLLAQRRVFDSLRGRLRIGRLAEKSVDVVLWLGDAMTGTATRAGRRDDRGIHSPARHWYFNVCDSWLDAIRMRDR